MEVADVVVLSKSTLNQWLSAQDKQFSPSLSHMTQEDGLEHWYVPDVNMININTDAAIFETSQCFSYSMEAFFKCSQGCIKPEEKEVIGVREALSWIKNNRGSIVIVETDCLVSAQAIRNKIVMLSYFGRVIEDCRSALEELKDSNVSLRFVKHSANNVAHYIVRHSSSIAERRWRVDNVHSDLMNVMLKDLKC